MPYTNVSNIIIIYILTLVSQARKKKFARLYDTASPITTRITIIEPTNNNTA